MMNKCIVFFVYGLMCLKCSTVVHCSDIIRLRAAILRNYDPMSRPVQNHRNVTNIDVDFVYKGHEFDEHKGMLTLHLITLLFWKDEHVQWDPQNYGNLSTCTFAQSELWRPDISVLNNYDESEIDHFANVPIFVYHDSSIWWSPASKFQVGCETDFRRWPYDRQTCYIYVGSWMHDATDLNLSISNYSTGELQYSRYSKDMKEGREWRLAGSSVKLHTSVYCCPEFDWLSVVIKVDLERRSASHTAAVSVVGSGIAIAILMSFLLDPFASERIPLTLLVMFVNAIYLQFMYRTIPNNGATVPLAICFFRDSLVMVTFALVWTVLIRYVAKTKRHSPVPLPDFVEGLLNSVVAKILCLNPRPQSKLESQRKCAESSEDGDVSELVEDDASSHQEDWEWLARLLDRIAFFFYWITYTIFILAFL